MSSPFDDSHRQSIAAARRIHERLRHDWSGTVDWLRFPGRERDDDVFAGYPYLFQPLYPGIEERRLQLVSVAWHLLAESVFAYDAVLDDEWNPLDSAASMLRAQVMQTEAMLQMSDLFAPSSPFWSRYRACYCAYVDAMLEEQRFVRGERRWNAAARETLLHVARTKSELAKIVPIGMAALAGAAAPHEWLIQSVSDYHTAFQLRDDVLDWKADLRRGIPTFVTVGAFDREAASMIDFDHAARVLYGEGHIQRALSTAVALASDALAVLPPELPRLPWHQLVEDLGRACGKLLAGIDELVEPRRAISTGGL